MIIDQHQQCEIPKRHDKYLELIDCRMLGLTLPLTHFLTHSIRSMSWLHTAAPPMENQRTELISGMSSSHNLIEIYVL